MTLLLRFANQLFIQSWWVILFIFACSILFEQSLKGRNQIYQQLIEQLSQLQQEKEQALVQQRDLQLQINSHNDRSWIELTLIKELGLVPEGQQKIYFYPADSLHTSFE